MLTPEKDISCGIFDSSLLRKKQTKSNPRVVASYELEIFLADGGVSFMNDEHREVRRGMLLCAKPGAIRRSDFPVKCGYIRITEESVRREGILAGRQQLRAFRNERKHPCIQARSRNVERAAA